MGDWPLTRGGNRMASDGRTTASSSMVPLTSGGTANSVGNYAELFSSTPFEADAITVWGSINANTRNGFINLAIGAASSEVIILRSLGVSRPGAIFSMGVYTITLPLRIPAGVRLAANMQSTSTSDPGAVGVILHAAGPGMPRGFQRATDYGANLSTSLGVSVDPGGTANTKPGYTEITSSTTNPIKAMMVIAHDLNSSDVTAANHLLDIAVGAGGSEVKVLENIPIQKVYSWMAAWSGPYAVDIPAGTRIAAQDQCSINTSTIREIGVHIIGFD